MPEASVVIATRDRAAALSACLAALADQTAAGRFEVIVVDNGSSDDTAGVVAAAGPLATRVFVADPNRGKARNAGIAKARAPLVIFCDDDTLAPHGFVAAHLAAHGGASDRVVSGPIINVPDAQHLAPVSAANYSRAFFCTCNVSASKAALDAAGGFDEAFDLYGWEDTDLGVRLRASGMRRVFAWDAYIYHVKPPSSMTLERRLALAREKGEMAARFVRKSPTWAVKLATGAYAANFARAAIANAPPLRRLYQRVAGSGNQLTGAPALAAQALADAAYIDALRAALRDG
ncbi:MAG: glycosyltransferase [Candidatus Eremiobacteraeota bacterium]|nr:glycosyltransferase [Candidatus Eremiobacteraeota bacterium]